MRKENGRNKFVLLCHQRSGSNALQSIFRQVDDIHFYGQLFSITYRYAASLAKRRIPMPPYCHDHKYLWGPHPRLRYRAMMGVLRWLPSSRSELKHVENLWARDRASVNARAAGFKLHDLQMPYPALRTVLERGVDRVVLLRRENLLKASVSWAVAVQTNVWARKVRGQESANGSHRLDVEMVEWFIKETACSIARWRGMLCEMNLDYLEISYEDHVKAGNLSGLSKFLGVSDLSSICPSTEKLSKTNYEHIENAQEIDEKLGGMGYGRLFE